jgi:hypothetical protein
MDTCANGPKIAYSIWRVAYRKSKEKDLDADYAAKPQAENLAD